MAWIVGHNQSGYLPDSEPDRFEDWRDARATLVASLEQEIADYVDLDSIASAHVATLSKCVRRANELRYFTEASFPCNGVEFWLKRGG